MGRESNWSSVLRRCRQALVGGAVAVISASALAVPITYTFSGTGGTGTVGATPFTNAAYTITLTGDTTAVTKTFRFENVTTATMKIAGIGTATITEAVGIFDTHGFSALGFARTGADLLNVADPAFGTYSLTANLGPISGLTPFALSQFTALASTLGPITMPSSGPVTFQATVGVRALPAILELLLL
jgi:hypothetical protein